MLKQLAYIIRKSENVINAEKRSSVDSGVCVGENFVRCGIENISNLERTVHVMDDDDVVTDFSESILLFNDKMRRRQSVMVILFCLDTMKSDPFVGRITIGNRRDTAATASSRAGPPWVQSERVAASQPDKMATANGRP